MIERVLWLDKLTIKDVEIVGGKNASLGEMISGLASADVQVPGGFATTAAAFREFLSHNNLEQRINSRLRDLDIDDVGALAIAGAEIRSWVVDTPLPKELLEEITHAYAKMQVGGGAQATVAVRSSATAEDLPEASFAGQQETFLNVHGIDNVIAAIKHVFASLYNDRAISYRVHQ
ncbi:MAG: phosphoenolpyruvate synthase, partial [Gammaproteobacteria bacterium]|nr:phosphoenolpyruvate synthase [Gammaproteobacteria bacterium]